MQIAIMSDAHDKQSNLIQALQKAHELGCLHLIYLGDFVQPATLQLMIDTWPLPLDFVLGNNEYEYERFSELATARNNVHFHGYYGSILVDERQIFFTHMPQDAISKGLNAKHYDAVFYGHTHASSAFTAADNTLVVNPGELYGRREKPGFAIYCTRSNTVTFHQL